MDKLDGLSPTQLIDRLAAGSGPVGQARSHDNSKRTATEAKKATPERRPYLVQTGCLLTARPRSLKR